MKYVVLICARNEETYIGSCLASLFFQTIPPKMVIVVDDGSKDYTRLRAAEFSKHLPLMAIAKKDRGFSALGSPLMADTYNIGLEILEAIEWDFLLILGADTSIPPEYAEIMIKIMVCNPEMGVISGRYSGVKEKYAAATGRFIRREVIKKLGGRLPKTNAWEGSVNHCAQFMGYKIRSYPVPIYNLRPPSTMKRSFVGRGRAVKEMGYQWPNVLYKSFLCFKKGQFLTALQILWGYIVHKPQDPLPDWAQFIKESQRKSFKEKIMRLIKK